MTKSVKLRVVLACFLLSPAFLWGQEGTDFSPEMKIFLEDKIKEVEKDIQKEIKQINLDLSKKMEQVCREIDSVYALILTPTTGEKERVQAIKTLKKKVIDCQCRSQIDKGLLYHIYTTIVFDGENTLNGVYEAAKECEKSKYTRAILQESSKLLLDAYYKSKEEKK